MTGRPSADRGLDRAAAPRRTQARASAPGQHLDRSLGVAGESSSGPTRPVTEFCPRRSQKKPEQEGDDEGKGRGVALPLAPGCAAREAA